MNSLCKLDCRNPFAHGPSRIQEAAAYTKWLKFEQRVFGDKQTVTVHVTGNWDLSGQDNQVLHYILHHQRNRSKYYTVEFPEPHYFKITKLSAPSTLVFPQ